MPLGFKGSIATEAAFSASRTMSAAKGFWKSEEASVELVTNTHADIEFGAAVATVDLVDPLAVIRA